MSLSAESITWLRSGFRAWERQYVVDTPCEGQRCIAGPLRLPGIVKTKWLSRDYGNVYDVLLDNGGTIRTTYAEREQPE